MAERGDPKTPRQPDGSPDPDDLVGFSTPAHLTGRARETAPPVQSEPEPETMSFRFDRPAASVRPSIAHAEFADVSPSPSAGVQGVMGLYAVYALILFAVPTLGASALLGLLAVTKVDPPTQPVALSHFLYQQRTLRIAAIAAAAGALLILVGLGVFVLFGLAAWIIVRGAAGALKLKAGAPIADPRGWWI